MNKRILVISDMHLPYQHKDAIKFLAEIKRNKTLKSQEKIALKCEMNSKKGNQRSG